MCLLRCRSLLLLLVVVRVSVARDLLYVSLVITGVCYDWCV